MTGLSRVLCWMILSAVVRPCLAQGDDSAAMLAAMDAGRWVVGVAGWVDGDGNDSLVTNVNWAATSATWLSFGIGRSRSPADRADVSVSRLTAGVDHRFGAFGVRLDVGRWGDAAALESNDARASFYIQRERFRLGFAYKHRDIDVPFSITGPMGNTLRRSVDFGGDSFDVTLRVEVARDWSVFAAAAQYDYGRDLTLLPRVDRLNLLSASTLTLADSFIDTERAIGLERELGDKLINASFTVDRSAVDGSRYETFNAGLLFPVGNRLDLEVDIGRGRSDLVDSGTYVGVMLWIYGG